MPTTQSKLSRVSSGFGLSKLTGSRRNRKESGLHKHNPSTQVRGLVPWFLPLGFITPGLVSMFSIILLTYTSKFDVELFYVLLSKREVTDSRVSSFCKMHIALSMYIHFITGPK